MNNINEEKTKKTVEHARREPTSGPLARTRTLAKSVFLRTHTAEKTLQMCSHASLSSKKRPARLDLATQQHHTLACISSFLILLLDKNSLDFSPF